MGLIIVASYSQSTTLKCTSLSLRGCALFRAPLSQSSAHLGKKLCFFRLVVFVSVSIRRFFSASSVLGSRAGSVGIGVSACPGAAWVFNRRVPSAPATLALVFPVASQVVPVTPLYTLPRLFPGVWVSVRFYRGRAIYRVRGSASSLRAVAAWWSSVFWGAA